MRKIEYVAGFEVYNLDESMEVIDIKGAPPIAEFKWKHRPEICGWRFYMISEWRVTIKGRKPPHLLNTKEG
ncbi:DUF1064 domain-containing protein [Peribacillus asahii]|uniref:DUF1064 domain-containing protein n=1 Tax=Peribacillus asahii TaxID=228899 RepID=UPI0020796C16|nr:DUF1064 domain-containing protein [Peribacillus asahii]USK71789.1 DUF1064 domain-containing protein [Peribacillus asahii]